jgi:leucine dehydrogenase
LYGRICANREQCEQVIRHEENYFMQDFIFDLMKTHNYENIVFCQESQVGLQAIIVIHDTTLGPAVGGTRMLPYETEAEALQDGLRLARAMTYKCAAAGTNQGGGKCVVIGDPHKVKTEALLRTLGRFIHRLGGMYLTGMDVGTTMRDMEVLRMETPYVMQTWGDAARTDEATAFGVVQGIRACLEEVYGSPDLQGRTVAVQGVGAVGELIVKLLVEAHATVTIADVNQDRVQSIASRYGADLVSPDEIYRQPVDVYCPCALGSALSNLTIPALKCHIVCGSANNQLAEEHHGDLLLERNIVYAPDYIVNAGSSLFGADSLSPDGFKYERAINKVGRIYETLQQLFALAKAQHLPTHRAADVLAEQRIAAVRQARSLAKS